MNPTFLSLLMFTAWLATATGQDPHYTTDSPLPCVNKTFQVYVFIVSDSTVNPVLTNDELNDRIQTLNMAFAPICISFAVCHKTYVPDYSYEKINNREEIDLLTTRYRKKRRINLFFTNSVLETEVNSYSVFNGIQNPNGATLIVPASGSGLIHEMGHTFGLHHIFETKLGIETVDGRNCQTAGDLICDTPAAPAFQEHTKDCEFSHNLPDQNGEFYKTEIGNYMSHHFCAHCFFTKQQYVRMATQYLTSPFLMW